MGNKIGRRRQVVDEKYTRPQGLYEHRDIDHKKLRKLILESKLAPCYPGDEDCSVDLEECPICFLYYPSLNRSKCCMKGICTECFLQMKPPNSTRPTQCPFCKTPNYAVEYRGVKSKEEKSMEQVEEQRVIEAQIRMRQQEIQDEEDRIKEKKRQQIITNNNNNIINNNNNIDNNKCPSIRKLTPSEVEYRDLCSTSLSVPSFRCMTHEDDYISSQPSCSASMQTRPSHSRHNRDDNIEHLDLENVMVMEAIWLSIQEQQHGQGYHLIDPYTYPPPPPPHPYTCAVAALTEQNHHHPIPYFDHHSMIQRPGFIPSFDPRHLIRDEDGGECWSDAADAGTSYTGSEIMLDTGPIGSNGPVLVPMGPMGVHDGFVGGFEDPMMVGFRNSGNPPGLAWH